MRGREIRGRVKKRDVGEENCSTVVRNGPTMSMAAAVFALGIATVSQTEIGLGRRGRDERS